MIVRRSIRVPRPILFVAPLLLALPSTPVVAQDDRPGRVVSVTVRDGVTRGDEHYAALRPAEALEAYRGVLASDSVRFDALWKAARSAVDLGMLADDDDEAGAWYDVAADYAARAVAVAPDSAMGHQWRAIAVGRQALAADPRSRVELSQRVRTSARRAIEIDGTSAGAHNVLGQWHAEIQRLGGLTRFVAERLLGAETFRQASWAAAERHLARAIELEPEAIIHRVALARVYLDLERRPEAEVLLRRALELPVARPTDELSRREAEALLRELG